MVTIPELWTEANSFISYILGSALLLAIAWAVVWSYSIYKGNERHKDIMSRLERIEALINSKR